MRTFLLSLLLFCVVPSAWSAETGYRLVHPDGTVEFSDQPLPQGEEIELREAPTIQFVPSTSSPAGQGQTLTGGAVDSKGGEVSRTIAITSPLADETVWFDGTGVTVSVATSPALQSGQQVAITLDGKVVAKGGSNSFKLGEVDRGSHSLSAAIIDVSGSVLTSSPSVTFHLRQHTSIKRSSPPDTSPHYAPTLPE